MADVVQVHDEAHVRTIALNRPDKMNALTHELAWTIVGEVQKAAHDDDVWVVALTGRGKAFCAGLDLTGPGEDVAPLPPQERLLDDVSWVGRFALVGAGALVTRDVPDFALTYGSPARVHGHVCRCAETLRFERGASEAGCACGRRYVRDAAGAVAEAG